MGAFLGVLANLLRGVGQVGGAIGSGIGKVGSTIGGGIGDLAKTIAAGGEPVGTAGEATSSGLKGLFQNRLLAQLLASEGADLMGRTPGKNLGNALQTNIASQNLARVFANILAGGTPPPGIKHTIDGGGEPGTHKRTLTVDHSIFDVGSITPDVNKVLGRGGAGFPLSEGLDPTIAKFLEGVGNPSPSQPATTAPAPAGAEAQVPTDSTTSNPVLQMLTQLLGGNQVNLGAGFADLRPSDLAGVTPDMLSQALQFRVAQEQLGKKNIMDVLNMMTDIDRNRILENYYQGQLEQGKSADEVARMRENRMYLEWATKDTRPNLIQEYEYAKSPQGGSYTGSLEEFKNPETTNDWRNYLKAKADDPNYKKSFVQYQKEIRESGAPRLTTEQKVEEKIKMGDIDAWLYLKDPAKMDIGIRQFLESRPIKMYIANAENQGEATAQKRVEYVEGKFAAAGAKVNSVRMSPDNKTMIWNITRPDGKTEDYSYAVRD